MNDLRNRYKGMTRLEILNSIAKAVENKIIPTWLNVKASIEADQDYKPDKYKLPKESGLVCHICGKGNIPDPYELTSVFEHYLEEQKKGKSDAIKAIDKGLKTLIKKTEEIYGKEKADEVNRNRVSLI